MKLAQKNLIYLYCVTTTTLKYSNFEDMGGKVYPIYFRGLYATVSKVSPDEFTEDNLKKKLSDMEWVEKKVKQHETIIEEIMQWTTVLPFKFATVFNGEENIKRLLKERCTDFKKIIANLEGKEEWGLKIYCDPGKFKDTLEKEDERIKEIEKEIASAGKGKAYLLKKKRDELTDNILNERISECTQDSFEKLKEQSQDTKINKLLPSEVTQKKEKMVLNAVFLINKTRLKELEGVLAYLKTKYAPKGIESAWTGPWPPYNFCDLPKEETQDG